MHEHQRAKFPHVLRKNSFSARSFYFHPDVKFSYENITKENWLQGLPGTQLYWKVFVRKVRSSFHFYLEYLNSLVHRWIMPSNHHSQCCHSANDLPFCCFPNLLLFCFFFLSFLHKPIPSSHSTWFFLRAVFCNQFSTHNEIFISWAIPVEYT